MAEEVPVSDVLCNATEYLCKLGSNLRSRSENLKQKRISKDKLRNAHAVRKAATKLLLMCELSKKSLENVENGVKRVLTIVDASRCSPSVGAKTKHVPPKQKVQSADKECFYFEYGSCKLRISKKILLKHYTSVKVHAKSMPAALVDKYPVYYNCRLYQKRKKTKESAIKKKDKIEQESVVSTKNNKENKNSGSDVHETGKESEDEAIVVESDDSLKIPKREDKSKRHKDDKTKLESESKGFKGFKTSKESESVSKQNKTLLDKDNGTENKPNDNLNKNVENLASNSDKLIKKDKEKSKKESNDMESKTSAESKDPSKNTLDFELLSEKEFETKSKLAEKRDSGEKIEDKSDKPRKSKSVRFLDESSDSSSHKESVEGNDRKKRKIADENECNGKKVPKSDIVDLVDDDSIDSPKKSEKSHEVKNNTEKDEGVESKSEKKPMIKLVSLNKLLKPDVIEKLDENSKTVKTTKQTNIKTYESRKQKEDTAYLLEKRKEVSAFKPKKFNVVVTRLPKFSDSFLDKYDLKKILQNGSIVYEVSRKLITDSDNAESDASTKRPSSKKSRKKSKGKSDDPDINKTKLDEGVAETKNALLNSDSDSSTKSSNIETADKKSVSKTKDALLNSDSDSSNTKNKTRTTRKDSLSHTKNSLLNSDSDSSDNKAKQKTSKKDSLSKSKNALVDSDSDSSAGSKNKPKNIKKDSTKTKDALLNSDSDSSDNQNKQKTSKKDSLSESKNALVDSDSDSSAGSKNKPKNIKKDSTKTKDALLNSDSDSSDNKTKPKASKKDSLSKAKNALVDSDSDSSARSKNKQKSIKKDSLSKTKDALLNSDSDSSDNKKKADNSKKKSISERIIALLDADSDSSDGSKNKQEIIRKDSSSKTKTTFLDSGSDNSADSKNKPKPMRKDSFSKTKTALLNSDSDNSDSEKKSETDSLSKAKNTLLDSDSDSPNDKKKSETLNKVSSSKTKDAILDSDSSSGSKKGSDISKKDSISKTKSSDSENSDSKNKTETPKKDSLSEISEKLVPEDTNEKIDTLSSHNIDKTGEEDNESPDSVKDKTDKNGKGNNSGTEETNSLKSVEPPMTPESKNNTKVQSTPQSKRKLIMESMQAKKSLLTYSSSSETDDEQLKNTLKQVRNSLLHGSSSSDDDIDVKKIIKANRRQLATPSDSDESLKKSKRQRKSKRGLSDEKDREVSSIGQFDGTNDEQSDTSNSQMGRSKTKIASGSNQSSETVDSNDIEINRLSDLKRLNRHRRRRDSGEKAEARSTRRMPKAPLIEEEALGPESSDASDAASFADSDAGDVEELPPVSLQDLNGDGINHLAREDLLAQSDSSSSHNDKENGSEDDKKEDSDEEENVKSIRRKPNAISSDSEAGSSRRKAERVSDFEDSDSGSEPRKRTKRKKKGSDSDGSQSSNDGSKKKRRRIKQVNDSDGSGSDSENEGKNKHGRKNIRKVMSKDQLEEATKKAARQEKERIARIAERQKLYNNLEFDESGKPDEVVLEKVVLDFDPDTKEPLIEVDRGLVRKLKPHQANGIKFMWNACFESVKRIKKDRGSGCILAHCMGLGKTLQVVSLTHTLLTHSALTGVRRVLVVCPLSTVLNWVNEFTMWLKHAVADYEVDVFELSRHKQNSERAWQLQQWVESGGVCVLGYEMFRNLSADNNKKFKKKMLKTFQEALVDPGPDLVVCDEGHLLKNEKTSLSQSMNRVRTLRRIVLTGTPLQNNLKEYYCMVQFVKPNLLGKYNEYLNRFVNPITNGQYTDSTERDISIMKRRSHVLHTMLDGAVQRRDYGVLAPFLPPKHEFVLFITLTDIQVKLYQHYLDNYSKRPLPGKSSGFLFPDFQSLQRIWTHPLVLKYNSERYEIMQQKKRDKEEEDSEGSIADFIDDDSTPEESSTEESSDDLSDMSDDSRKKNKKKSAKKGKKDAKGARRGTRANPVELAEEVKPLSDIEEVKYENPTEWWMKLVTDEELEDIRHSHKLLLLFDILRQCEAIGDKLLVFSQSLYSLDLIEHFLGKVDEATQEARIDEKLAGHVGSWSPGVDYFRLDGSTSCENRSIWCKNFNREDNPRARLFLISTRAGGLGINLVAANRVVIFDVSWNPSHDVQSIFRVYRFGQKKPCYIYRFLAMGTMEEKIYERQVTKQAISKRVIDEQQIDRHYAAHDLAELYKFEPVPAEPRPVPSLPKDRLFAEMLKEHEKQIFRFHEHDSLLENKEEETLSEEERKRAWEEFENEKRAPPPAPFAANWSMHNGMASLLQQQQQQLAYTALAAMIRKDMPNINDNQLRDMLPIICNANPGMFGGYDYGLVQKMNEIYKYAAQPGMMNPSMMNPVMNPAGGMSTSSSLQYEPPWQRQQQQQQQMRLQQLMQQQHSMGAKYYAGGLGSRDPVAMALQQQRAREFLLGGGGAPPAPPAAPAGRPRGRPPLQPRAPAAADVVNLADSD